MQKSRINLKIIEKKLQKKKAEKRYDDDNSN